MSGMRTCSRFLLAAFALIFFALPFLHAEFPPISKDEMAITSVPEQPGASAVVLFRDQTDDDLKHFRYVYVRLKVLTEAGRKYADVEVPYEGSEFTVDEVHGRTTHADGTVVKFEGKPFDKLIVKNKDYKYRAKVFTLPDVQPGSIIEFSYLKRFGPDRVVAPRWTIQEDLFQRKSHFRYVPSYRNVRLDHGQTSTGIAWISMVPDKNGIKEVNNGYELMLANVPPFIHEEHMPPREHESYYVAFYYRTNLGPEKYWKEQGKFWTNDAEKFMDKTSLVESTLPQVVAATDTPEQKVRKIYAFVDTLENTTYRPFRTMQEEKTLGIKPSESVQDVLSKKSGDRDELTRLFVAMVRKAGVPAYLMKVTNRTLAIFEPLLLDWRRQLDDEIAIVSLNGQEMFLDPGTKHCPFGTIYWKFTASKGIRQLPGKETEIVDSPMPQFTEASTKRVARLQLTNEGELQGNLIVVYMGRDALGKRLEGVRTDTTGREKILVDEVKSWLSSNAEVTLSKQPAWDESEKPLTAEFKINTPALTSAGKRALLPLDVLQFGRDPVFAHAERQHTVVFKYPSRNIDEIHITLPASIDVESLPGNVDVKLPYAAYQFQRSRKGNELIAVRDLAEAILYVSKDKYKEVKDFFDKVKAGDDQQGVLRRTANAAGE